MIGSLLGIAVDALFANRLRTALTLLGVIIGVTSVMTIISALEGLQGVIEGQLARMGSSTFVVARIGMPRSEEEFLEQLKRKPITMTSADLVERECRLCERVVPRTYGGARIKYRDQALRNAFILGTTSGYIDVVDLEVAQGRFISHEDDQAARPVAYIGETVRESLLEGLDPIGKEISINGKKFTVIGVSQKESAMFGQDHNNFVMVPLSVYMTAFGDRRGNLDLVIKAGSVDMLSEGMDEVRLILRAQRHVPVDKNDDFEMLTADNILDMLNAFTRILRLTLVGISSISLVVGGIVVMNIMMVSVTERTREIGIRKSLGARRNHILTQFLLESLLVTLSGGAVGIGLGFILAKALVGLMDMEIAVSGLAITLGLAISTGVGLFFGIYPAMRAARLDPVKALSYE